MAGEVEAFKAEELNWATLGDAGMVDFYLGFPGAGTANAFTRTSADKETKTVIGFGATHLAEVNLGTGEVTLMTPFAAGDWKAVENQEGVQLGLGEKTIELALSLKSFPAVQAGDAIEAIAKLVTAKFEED